MTTYSLHELYKLVITANSSSCHQESPTTWYSFLINLLMCPKSATQRLKLHAHVGNVHLKKCWMGDTVIWNIRGCIQYIFVFGGTLI